MDGKISHVSTNQKKARGTTLISDTADFKASKVISDKGHYMMI